jgi:DNA polymerase-3 subunit epsilon
MTSTMKGYAVLDLETTGLDPQEGHRIIQVGIVFTDPTGRPTRMVSAYVHPQRPVDGVEIHGITDAMLADAPPFADIAEHLLDELDGYVLVSHNVRFDLGFLLHEASLAGVECAKDPQDVFCTLRWAKEFIPGLESRSLRKVTETLGIDITAGGNGKAHDALTDATATAKVLRHYLQTRSDLVAEKRASAESLNWHLEY